MGRGLPLNPNGQLPRARHRFNNNVALGHAARQQLCLGALQQRVDDLGVPARMHDANAQAGAVMLLGGGTLHDWIISACLEVSKTIFERCPF